MPGSTPNRGYPFPLIGDPPAGDSNFQDLAIALDTDWAAQGRWLTYTPVLTGSIVQGNGTVEGRYCRIGDSVFVQSKFTLGSTSAVSGSEGYIAMSYPPGTTPLQFNTVDCAYYSSILGGLAWGIGFISPTSGGAQCYGWPAAGSDSGSPITPTEPFTWAAGDVAAFTYLFETS